jgi:hypothetical protein
LKNFVSESMPRTIMLNNVILLLCCSALAGSGLSALTGADGIIAPRWVLGLNIIGAITAVLMLFTEAFSGMWLPAVGALVSLAVGGYAYAMRDGDTVPVVSEAAWIVGWVFAASWFAYLAGVARENR